MDVSSEPVYEFCDAIEELEELFLRLDHHCADSIFNNAISVIRQHAAQIHKFTEKYGSKRALRFYL